MSEYTGYFTRLLKFWFPDLASVIWLIASVMPVLFFQTLIHEGSHALNYIDKGLGVNLIVPFPHQIVSRNGNTSILNGRAVAKRSSTNSNRPNTAVPQFVAIGLLITLTLFLLVIPYFWSMKNRAVRLLLRAWFLGLCFDLIVNTGGKLFYLNSPGNDWNRYQAANGYSNNEMFGFSLLIICIPLSYFIWGYFSAWHRDPPESSSFAKNISQDFWGYRWAALVFLVLSGMAIIFSLVVSDPSINKDHWAYLLPLVFQFIFLAVFIVYFIMSFFFPRQTNN